MSYEILGIEKLNTSTLDYGIRVINHNYDPKSGYSEQWIWNSYTIKTHKQKVCEFLNVDSIDSWIVELDKKLEEG